VTGYDNGWQTKSFQAFLLGINHSILDKVETSERQINVVLKALEVDHV